MMMMMIDDDEDNEYIIIMISSHLYITCALVGKIGYCLMTAFIHLFSI